MNIQNINDSLVSSYSAEPKKASNPLTQAIKDYRDEYLTGLTDEEREKIKKEIAKYIDSLPKGAKVDPAYLKALVGSLLKKFGYKGNVEDMTSTLVGEFSAKLQKDSATSEEAQIAYEKLSTLKPTDLGSSSEAQTAAKTSGLDSLSENESTEQEITQTITNPDGSKSIVVLRNDVIVMTCKITKAGDILREENEVIRTDAQQSEDTDENHGLPDFLKTENA